jgi:hypothetical protein
MTFRYGIVTVRVRRLLAVALEPLGAGARPSPSGCTGKAPLRRVEGYQPDPTLSGLFLPGLAAPAANARLGRATERLRSASCCPDRAALM